MKAKFFPGCTLKSKAKNLEESAILSAKCLDIDLQEIDRWNCCGAVYSLTDDDLIHQVASVRNLIRAKEQGGDKLIALCSMCYNTLARANLLIKNEPEKRKTINWFMDEEIDYFGDIEVIHFLSYINDNIGWEKVKEKVKKPLTGLKIAPYYGCTLQRPSEIEIEPIGQTQLMTNLFVAMGATVVDFPASSYCCGSYQVMGKFLDNINAAENAALKILNAANILGVDALVTSCPLCEFNLGKHQDVLDIEKKIPTFYFTQLMALAFGLDYEICHLELNNPICLDFLKKKKLLS